MPPTVLRTSRDRPGPAVAGRLRAVLVGVNSYADPALPDLQFCTADCQQLAQALAHLHRGAIANEIAVHGGNGAPTSSQSMRWSLERLVETSQPEDTVLFYFSGHGQLDSGGQVVLCLSDAGGTLPVGELLAALERCPARQRLLWLDACHGGGLGTARDPAASLVEAVEHQARSSRGLYAILACDAQERSWEFAELGHGVFTYFLIRGLAGEAADAQGLIDADSLYKYVYNRTLRYIDRCNQQLRLIAQQKRRQGDSSTSRFAYSLQAPRRCVGGAGEVVLGSTAQRQRASRRQALVIDGGSGKHTSLQLSRELARRGDFAVQYWPPPGGSAISAQLLLAEGVAAGSLIYLRGRLTGTADALHLEIGAEQLGLAWLEPLLQRAAPQLLLFDWVGEPDSLICASRWLRSLQGSLGDQHSWIAGLTVSEQSEQVGAALLTTLKQNHATGLTAADWLSRVREELASSAVQLETWLCATQGVVEVLPERSDGQIGLDICPYMGLRPFLEEAAPYFYGREALVQKLLLRLEQHPLLAVIGASGSGKSSLVQAGLLAQLRTGQAIFRSDRWWLRSMRPGERPTAALIDQLGATRPAEREALEGLLYLGSAGLVRWLRTAAEGLVVLVIDQAEELFSQTPAAERERFLELILGALKQAADRFKVVFILRADFTEAALAVDGLREHLEAATVYVPATLDEQEYRQAIVRPAEQVGLTVEPELVEVLIGELGGSAGELPLLEFVLEQLWEHRREERLGLAAYRECIGGLAVALEKRADQVYQGLSSEAQACAHWLFTSLTQLGDGVPDTRRRLGRDELNVPRYPPALVEETIKAFSDARLLVVNTAAAPAARSRGATIAAQIEQLRGETTIEVAHEVLIRHWSTLRWWLEENRTRLYRERQIEQAACLWRQRGAQPDFLLRGVRLAEAEEIYVRHGDELSQEVGQFIEACLAEQRSQQQRQQKQLRQARLVAGAMVLLAVTALVFGALFFYQAQSAQKEEVRALGASADGFLASRRQLEALVAATQAARRLDRTLWADAPLISRTEGSLRQVLDSVQEFNRLTGHSQWVTSVSFSPDGERIASASADGTVRLWSRRGTLLQVLRGHTGEVTQVRFAPNGERIATAGIDRTVRLWDNGGHLLQTLIGHGRGIYGLSFSPDGQLLATASADRTIRLWRMDGTALRTLHGHTGPVLGVAFSPDGQLLATASADRTVRLWRTDGTALRTLRGHSDWVQGVAFSPDSRTLATGSLDKTVRLWKRSGEPVAVLRGHTDAVPAVRFSPDGRFIASASFDKTVRLWQLNAQPAAILSAHTGEVSALDFSPDSRTLATASLDKTVRLWHLTAALRQRFIAHRGAALSVTFSPNGQLVATAGADDRIRLWGADGRLIKTLSTPGGTYAVRFSPDGEQIASAGADGNLRLWQRNGQPIRAWRAHGDRVRDLDFAPDGQLLASAGADGTVRLWNSAAQNVATLRGHAGQVTSVRFSPDGHAIATAGTDGTVRLWSTAGSPIALWRNHRGMVTAVRFSPDGRFLASAGYDGTITLRDRLNPSIRSWQAHSDWIDSLAFSPDGTTLASVSHDGSLRLWKPDGTPGVRFGSPTAKALTAVTFSPDGTTLAAAGIDGTVLFQRGWQLGLKGLVAQSCSWLADYLINSPDSEVRPLCDGIPSQQPP
ncbi:caspase family protein [Gloeobacter kilaueensis]|uniref:WD-40 repeat-containing protein n=1 Tax=Gloeobacter kilaueensis (strain ATCC BAA-2537 / CCAP 1431/1 / ULC 316 / JS1) TaxID=1183438 RepID=U5QK96_GLOK1|nr:caspase family protein [Gloeobacter kilaueensis]AGY58115.1 WD-40 repeat-containing protein [Gloeobacter kilaueensis JS1]